MLPPHNARIISYYDGNGRMFSQEHYRQLRLHSSLAADANGFCVPHEHRLLYSDRGHIGSVYRALDNFGNPVSEWYKD